MFELDPRLAGGSAAVCDLPLSAVRLQDDRSFPWLVLVPRRSGLRELLDLGVADRAILMEEMALAAQVLRRRFRPDKLNIGALGNLVEQLHVHVIGRFHGDRAWPGPAWGSGPALPYAAATLAAHLEALRRDFRETVAGDA